MGRDDLYITVPSFFRCPISLDVMESPVSLCTGVTYDRASIQRWLDSGNNTCPATMQVLHSKDLIPNHTLHRLIQIWSHKSGLTRPEPDSLSSHQALDLITKLINNNNNNPTVVVNQFNSFIKLLCFASESPDNRKFLASNSGFVDFLIRVISDPNPNPNPNPELLEPGLKILQLISPKITAVLILKTHPGFFPSLTRILKTGRPDSRLAIYSILQTITPDTDSKKSLFDSNELISQLLELLKSSFSEPSSESSSESESILSLLIYLTTPRSNKLKLIRSGAVRIITSMIRTVDPDSTLTELGLTLLEMISGSAEGRAAITEDSECVPRIVQRLMKGTSSANEHGVALIWSLCYLFRDQKAKEGVMRSNGGLTKILLLMQSDCSPAVKRMCCDLLRIFRVNSKSCLASYDSKTTHIMPC